VCLHKAWSADTVETSKSAGVVGFHHELLVLVATQWFLLSGAIAWLVFHAANNRQPQVLAGLLMVLVLLGMTLCTVVYVLREHRRKVSAVAAMSPGMEEDRSANASHSPPDVARLDYHAPTQQNDRTQEKEGQAMELASMTSSFPLPADLNRLSLTSFKSHRSSAKSSHDSHEPEDSLSLSGNYVGKLWSDGDGSLGRGSILKESMDMESQWSINRILSDKSIKHRVVFEEMPNRSSRGRWRLLFPSLAEASTFSPTASATSAASVKRLGSSFVFESEEDVQLKMARDIQCHGQHLAVQTGPPLSPSASMRSQTSFLSIPDEEARRRPSSSSAMSDISSFEKRSKSRQSSFGS